MCGIFGFAARQGAAFSPKRARVIIDDLFRLSESRGKEAAGIAVVTTDKLYVYKEAIPATALIRRKEYRDVLSQAGLNGRANGHSGPTTIIGHSRLVTTGSQDSRVNNQPVINAGAVGVHNGIVVNAEELWRRHPEIERHGDVDSEIIVGLIRRFASDGCTLAGAFRRTFSLIKGAASVAVVFNDLDSLVLATNNGSLYTAASEDLGIAVFASEEYILRMLRQGRPLASSLGPLPIHHVGAQRGLIVNLKDLARREFSLTDNGTGPEHVQTRAPRLVVDIQPWTPSTHAKRGPEVAVGRPDVASLPGGPDPQRIAQLRRCSRCILPETMPFIDFDAKGVCNYCRSYRRQVVRGGEELGRILAKDRGRSTRYDCLVGLSGGRDSTYGLHYIKRELGLNPIAFTYDWGMVTDLARRNISRVCGQLGVEHLLISADLERKRRYIRRNVEAWLRKPALGMVPLFMAGDKQYFFHANRLRKQNSIPTTFLCENMLERTDFKTGFAGVRPQVVGEDHAYSLRATSKVRLATYYGMQYLLNPSYLNGSVLDTASAYLCYYFVPKDFLNLYRFVEWNERRIIHTLRDEYDWELATDTDSTWRIGDGTASFYNYIYLTVAGLTEVDTLRSNQIREGSMTRSEALELSTRESRPRYESIRWYLTTIGMGDAYEAVIRRINAIPKLYAKTC